MSRIITNNLRHNDATADNLTLDGTGNITAPGNFSVTGTSTLTDDLVVDTDTLFVDASTDRVGIGTSSPTRPLTVVAGSGETVNILGVFDTRSANPATVGNSVIAFSDPTSTAGQFATRLGSVGDSLAFYTNGSNERLRITSDGTLQLRNSPGIDFSQIQTNATGMTSELLDSYEEGSWTPAISGATLSGASGNYTKIGRFVHAFFYCPVSSHNNNTTEVEITGLPFTAIERSPGVSLIVRNGIDHTIQLLGTHGSGSFSSIKFAKTVNDGNSDPLRLNDCNTSWHLAGVMTYHAQ